MRYSYKPKNVCPSDISFDIENEKVYNVQFTGGCNGNLKAIPLLIEGTNANEVISKLKGLTCGRRSTSCTDQLTLALSEALESN